MALIVSGILLLARMDLYPGETEEGAAEFPAKPIKIIVYTKPGGLIDITARKFTDIASKYTDVIVCC